jgi:glycosyltransferase involved in cell wall biosynthesis
LVIGALAESLINFRGELIKSLVSGGHKVVAMAGHADATTVAAIEALGAVFRPYPVQRNGMNPVHDLTTFLVLRSAIADIKPDVVMAYTIKPVIWGGLAALLERVPHFFALVEGLGYAFQGGSWRRRIVGGIASVLYKASLYKADKVIFLNPDNRTHFLTSGLIRESQAELIDGIGLDIDWYSLKPLPAKGIVFLCIARLLGEKGLREYAQAASIVKAAYPDAEFYLVGQTDPSPDGIPLAEVETWHASGIVTYFGASMDIRPFIERSHVYVLPSYHEGMPRTVLEAMSMGRPILTTDVPGCRETVIPSENGYLVPKGNSGLLADKMIWFIENRDQWERMGQASRRIAEERFDVRKINTRMLRILGLSAVTSCGHETNI